MSEEHDATASKLDEEWRKAKAGFDHETMREYGGVGRRTQMTPLSKEIPQGLIELAPCPPLSDEEWERVQQGDAELIEWEEERRRAKRDRLLRQSELPYMFEEFHFSSFDAAVSNSAARAVEACLTYAGEYRKREQAGRGIILSGPVGTGKTHLCVAVMRFVMDRFEVPALFITMPSLLERERRSYDGESEQERGAIEQAMNADLLVLDDLGAERTTEWAQEKIFALVNHRYARGMPIVTTTNLGLQALMERVGQRAMSRLLERSEWVAIEGEDYRVKGLMR